MKNMRITNLSKQEIKALEILEKEYKKKTRAGAARKAILEMAQIIEYKNSRKAKTF